ncbi:hypothetical protein EYF80_049649 [Liparis tanakae]|uniref:Uncharacterized protein n=1 Tax=Liparis tanakae TaxID=230148 RepID=A0A4Z2FG92_9TELE|nr:hypothetical protein EYF80_049649 [Liparis tanakae]
MLQRIGRGGDSEERRRKGQAEGVLPATATHPSPFGLGDVCRPAANKYKSISRRGTQKESSLRCESPVEVEVEVEVEVRPVVGLRVMEACPEERSSSSCWRLLVQTSSSATLTQCAM